VAILHNGVIIQLWRCGGSSGCYYNYPLCKYSFGVAFKFVAFCMEQLFAFLF